MQAFSVVCKIIKTHRGRLSFNYHLQTLGDSRFCITFVRNLRGIKKPPSNYTIKMPSRTARWWRKVSSRPDSLSDSLSSTPRAHREERNDSGKLSSDFHFVRHRMHTYTHLYSHPQPINVIKHFSAIRKSEMPSLLHLISDLRSQQWRLGPPFQ